ncbi:hypothetical protein M422DRAFT_26015 [Sphaerobolus stellatus SS14]|nr:hypothetical protein M422DRAFT_26015 [Sphaerobolus stellatus SS14]
MRGPVVPSFVLTLAAFVLLVLIVFSAPFIKSLFFLRAHTPDVVDFGMWGFCIGNTCTPKTLGYERNPEIIVWLTKVLVFFPIAAGFTGISLLALLPAVVYGRRRDIIYPPPLYSLMLIPSAFASVIAFAFQMALFTVAKIRFDRAELSASYGACPWMSLVAMIILLGLMFYTGCGSTWRGPFGQMSPYIQNRLSGVYAY